MFIRARITGLFISMVTPVFIGTPSASAQFLHITGSPSGAQAAGDSGGTLTAPTVTGIQGKPVSASIPKLGQSQVRDAAFDVPSQIGGLDVTTFVGSDIGAKISAAVAALGSLGGELYIPAASSCYSYSTPIVLPFSSIKLNGGGKYATCLQYTGTSGVALTAKNWSTVSNLKLLGPGGTGATGLLVEGAYSNFDHLVINGFGLGLTFGNNTYQDNFSDVNIETNNQNIYYPTGLTNSGENISFELSTISGGGTFTNCFQIGTPGTLVGAELSFADTSFDTCQVVNNEGILKVYGGHFEDGGAAADHPFLKTYSSNLDATTGDAGSFLYGVSVEFDTAAPTGTGAFEVDKFGQLHVNEFAINNTPSIPIVQLGSSSSDSPALEFIDASNPATEAQLYSVYSGATPVLNISTRAVSEHTSATSHVFANNLPGYGYGHNQAVIAHGNFLGEYQWAGSGSSWIGQQFKPNGSGTGFQICGSGYFRFAGYAALGSETTTCGTAITNTAIVTQSYTETLTTPASSRAACTAGQFTDDANYHYVCTATNTWKRVALSTF
jgi:hypothetical protein